MSSMASGKPESGFGRTFLVGGSVVAAILATFYINMLQSKKREQAAGLNPYYEQVVAEMNKKAGKDEQLRPMHVRYSEIPPAFPGSEHNPGRMTIAAFNRLPDHSPAARFQVPPPQRGRNDGTENPYTKSPDYVKNYGKTDLARRVTMASTTSN